MTTPLIILGTGGNCLDILDTVELLSRLNDPPPFKCIGFLDDQPSSWKRLIRGVPVLGPLSMATELADCQFINGIGSPSNFWRKPDIIGKTGVSTSRFATVVHPSAVISESSVLGPGTVVFQQVTITTDVTIGKHVIILPNSVISHGCTIGDYSCIAGSVCVCGEVSIGPLSYLGASSSIINGVTVGSRSLVGIGSVVTRDVEENAIVVGNPARFLRRTVPD